ncbi:SDR family mycofactocin-dependent oxidoreductase [Rhodococcoides fascians]|uniref:mycofactocin-coupled SDR family oxidoreductase n=1 Tax=Rhodococcoides fascians TaxID=1828 RepID=UPI000B9B6935|nr:MULTISPECIES: mycofactocin-coupled SDR family oxidoreductase [Rhodococcus]OZD68982.1 SDR family mycofactocin-dependent oxidoreductase [Rhodococcus sp. 06-1059B-a]OZE81085.1 SDR family mycofactocin-dependent oxidoreductase [Rhodococcus fascians]OZF08339.1 SDR family mycofactocin-dependent oxidoreductase [Rhodococcus fascians]OZF12325.1 SDR family mycofactocin-dependent oxidoreductase [Rhodococcus fascians]OZF59095.1 SDR family mycofactocin-dependent oxidoreductase [Rhodococcus fascians]
MTGKLDGKVAFITGAARGQGRSHALRLASEGADIIAVDACANTGIDYVPATAADLEQTVKEVEALGRNIFASCCDVRNYEGLAAALATGISQLGRLDVVCANAGILTMGLSHEQSEEQWRNMIDINLTGVWHTTKAATPYLIDQGEGGSMILTSSLMGLKGGAGASSYTAAKFGVTGLAKTLAIELAPHRIRVNSIHPTNVRTPMLDSEMIRKAFRPDLDDPQLEDTVEAYASLNLWPLPWVETSDVSNGVLYLASDESRYVTGTALSIDLGAAVK